MVNFPGQLEPALCHGADNIPSLGLSLLMRLFHGQSPQSLGSGPWVSATVGAKLDRLHVEFGVR